MKKYLIETMPDHLRESHRKAGNWGTYPANGAERSIVDACDVPAEDAEYDHIVREARLRDLLQLPAFQLPRLPAHLHAAYDWTAAAGELEELGDLTGDALLTYCKESAENSAEHVSDPSEAITAYELEQLHDWLNGERIV